MPLQLKFHLTLCNSQSKPYTKHLSVTDNKFLTQSKWNQGENSQREVSDVDKKMLFRQSLELHVRLLLDSRSKLI